MSKQFVFVFSIFFILIFQLTFTAEVNAQTSNPRIFRERFVIQAVQTIHSAEATYQATTGNGLYGSLEDLRQANLIDAVLADGEKYGYFFALSKTNPTATTPANFQLTATPRSYLKAGRYSFYIDRRGDIHGADKNGAVATVNDSIVDDCSLYGDIEGNERCTLLALRTLYKAEMTYVNTVGNGSFGTHYDLYLAGLIRPSFANGSFHGYLSLINVYSGPNPSFYIATIPQNYGVTGRRSFYIGMDGILRGADHQGGNADENDPPINN